MEPTDLTIRILLEIRDEQRATRTELKAEMREVRTELKAELHEVNERLGAMNLSFNTRFEVIETALRDMAEPLVMLARGVKTALEVPADVDRRFAECERRLDALEKPPH